MPNEPDSTVAAVAHSGTMRGASRNYGAALIDVVGFISGISFFAPQTVLQEFVGRLTGSNIVIGLLSSVSAAAICLTQLLVVNRVERLPIKKWYVVVVATVERVALLSIAVLTPILAVKHPTAMIVAVLSLLCVTYLTMGCSMPAYSALISKVVPTRRRGSLYGTGATVANVLTLGTGLLIPFILRSEAWWGGFPNGFAVCFSLGAAILFISYLPLATIAEPQETHDGPKLTNHEYFRELWTILRQGSDFRFYLLSACLFWFGAIGNAFYMIYAIRDLGAPAGESGWFTMIIALGSLSSFLWGSLIDRADNRTALALGLSLMAGATVWAVFAPSLWLFYPVIFLTAVGMRGIDLAGHIIQMEFSPPSHVPRYVALTYSAQFLPRLVAPLIGGVLADAIGYKPVFVFAGIMSALSLLALLKMRDPRRLASRIVA